MNARWSVAGSKVEQNLSEPWVLTSKKVCLDGVLKQAWILIEGEKISDVFESEPEDVASNIVDVGDLVVLPGLVDTHVHLNEPGREEWEGFETATHAAAAGGITSLVDMPLNCVPVTTSAEALRTKLDAVGKKLWVDVGFWGGVVPENLDKLPALLEGGVLGVKTFMIDSGIKEFKPLTLEQIGRAMPILKKHNLPYLFLHFEQDPFLFLIGALVIVFRIALNLNVFLFPKEMDFAYLY